MLASLFVRMSSRQLIWHKTKTTEYGSFTVRVYTVHDVDWRSIRYEVETIETVSTSFDSVREAYLNAWNTLSEH